MQTAEQGGRVYGVQLDGGGRFRSAQEQSLDLVGPLGLHLRVVSVGKWSSGRKHTGGESHGGHFLYTLSTVTGELQRNALLSL